MGWWCYRENKTAIWLVLEPAQASPWHSWDQKVARIHSLTLAQHPQKGTGAHGASGLGCDTGSSWWLILPHHLGISTSRTVGSMPGSVSHGPMCSSTWRWLISLVWMRLRVYSAVCHSHGHPWDPSPWASGSARLSCGCSSSIASAFPLGLAIASDADVAVQASSARHGAGLSASQLVYTARTDPWGTFLEHWGTITAKIQKRFNTYSLGTCDGKGTKTVLLLRITQTYANQIVAVKHRTSWTLD